MKKLYKISIIKTLVYVYCVPQQNIQGTCCHEIFTPRCFSLWIILFDILSNFPIRFRFTGGILLKNLVYVYCVPQQNIQGRYSFEKFEFWIPLCHWNPLIKSKVYLTLFLILICSFGKAKFLMYLFEIGLIQWRGNL